MNKKAIIFMVVIILALGAVALVALNNGADENRSYEQARTQASERAVAPLEAAGEALPDEEQLAEAAQMAAEQNPQRDTEPLHIVTADGTRHDFHVELATTPDQQAMGLMFRTELAEDHGMLFMFEEEAQRNFWMKNTYIPLDMIFIKSDGTVQSIAKNTRPLSLAVWSSGQPVLNVLEVPAGTADRLDIQAGDTIHHESFGNMLAE